MLNTFAAMIMAGRTADEMEITSEEYGERKKIIDEFLLDNEWDEDRYLVWLLKHEQIRFVRGKYLDSHIWRYVKETKSSHKIGIPKTEQAKNLYRDVKSIISSGGRFSTDEEYEQRMAICRNCEYLLETRCKRCGCYMNIKAKFKAMKCPIGKW